MRYKYSLCGLLCVALCLSSCDLVMDFAQSKVAVITTHEGSQADPVTLSLSIPYSGKVGNDDTTCSSYYSFTSDTTGFYNICLSADYDDFNLKLYSSSDFDFENLIGLRSSSLYYVLLNADTRYYIEVDNNSNDTLNMREYTITVSPTVAPIEGIKIEYLQVNTSPVLLSLGTPYAGKVGKTYSGLYTSYYSFTTTDNAYYQIALTNLSEPDAELKIELSVNDTQYSFSNLDSPPDMRLYPNKVYNFHVQDCSSESLNLTYTLTVRRTSDLPCEGTVDYPISLSVGEAHNGKVGEYKPWDGYFYESYEDMNKSYYKFTISDNGVYSLNLSNLTNDVYWDLREIPFFEESGLDGLDDFLLSPIKDMHLESGTTYYLCILNRNKKDLTYTITISKTQDALNEGSKYLPISLSTATPHSGKVGKAHTYSPSTYSFTPESSGRYTFTISDILPSTVSIEYFDLNLCEPYYYAFDLCPYEDLDFYSFYSLIEYYEESGFTLSHYFKAGTTYYLVVVNSLVSDTSLTYTLSVAQD